MGAVRLALIGCGNIMHKHAQHSKDIPEVEIVALCDIVPRQMDLLVQKSLTHLSTPPPQYTDLARLYREVKPSAVVVATPHTLHYAQGCQALEAGCHVLMEKPMVTSLAHALDMERRVAGSGKVFCIGYNTPCTAELYTLREMIRTRELGRLKVVSLYLSQNWYRLTKGAWRQDPKLSGGGQMYDSGAHLLNSLIWTVESDVAEVYAHLDRLDAKVEINGTATVRFANGVLASVAITGEGPNGSHGTWVFEEGRVDLDPWSAGLIEVYRLQPGGWQAVKVKYPLMRGKDGQPLSNFVDAILGRDEPRTSARNGVHQSQLMDAVYRSAETGRPAGPQVSA